MIFNLQKVPGDTPKDSLLRRRGSEGCGPSSLAPAVRSKKCFALRRMWSFFARRAPLEKSLAQRDLRCRRRDSSFEDYVLLLIMNEKTRNLLIHFPKENTASLTAWTTPVSNQLRSPRLRASVSELIQKCAFALGIPSNI